ncbi:MAG: OsmC family protein [Paracoccaceae bacterium]|nr:OsmC family protein [Paracoccaceae bacterium]
MTHHIAITFGPVAGTGAGLGQAGAKSLIADRPEGKAGGTGLGFNGGELLASALGGCLWNDLHYAADAAGVAVRVDTVEAEIELAGTPPRVVRGRLAVGLSGADEAGRAQVFEAACEGSTIANSLTAAFSINFELRPTGAKR